MLLYDDENQLVEWRQSSGPTSGAMASTFVYDGLGRLRARGEYQGNGSSWVFQRAVTYIYDGMRVIEERDGNNWPQVAYTRGTDLSGSLEGAGGIGGLLARSHDFTNCSTTLTYWLTNNSGYCISNLMVWDAYQTYVADVFIEDGYTWNFSWPAVGGRQYTVWGDSCDFYFIQVYGDPFSGTLDTRTVDFCGEGCVNISESGLPLCDGASSGVWLTHNYYHADGNGNVTALVSTLETLTASYRYDPFGNTISQSGSLANANKYRFSSKLIHATSGLYYYGYRWYSPSLQRWVNQDPLGEAGFEQLRGGEPFVTGDGPNHFAFVGNSPLYFIDAWGLALEENIKAAEKAAEEAKQAWQAAQDFCKRSNYKPDSDEAKKAMEKAVKLLDDWGMKKRRLQSLRRLRSSGGFVNTRMLVRGNAVVSSGLIGYEGGRALGNSTPYRGGGTIDENVQEAIFDPFWNWWYGYKPEE